ncbi:MAG: mechanosensitive ion channel domain-containing protein [Planctomycetales bacterium]
MDRIGDTERPAAPRPRAARRPARCLPLPVSGASILATRPWRRWLAVGLAACGLLFVAAGPVAGQTEAPARPAEREEPPPVVPKPPELAAETVRTRLEQVQSAKDLDESVRKKAVELYNQALEQLRIADEHATRIAELSQLRQQAPAAVADLQARAAEPAAEPTIEVPPDADVAKLQQELAAAEAELAAARKRQSDLESQRMRRTERRTKIPEEQTAAKQRLEDVDKALAAPPQAAEPAEVTAANRAFLHARRQALAREIEKLEQEVPTYDATFEMVSLQLADAARRVTRAEKVRKKWEDAVQRRRARDAEKSAQLVRDVVKEAHPAISGSPLAQRVKSLALARTRPKGLPAQIKSVTTEIGEMDARLKQLDEGRAGMEQKLELTGMEQVIGSLLLEQRRDLPNVRKLRRNIQARQKEISRVRLELLTHEEERTRLGDVEAQIVSIRRELPDSVLEESPEAIDASIRGLVESYRNLLDSQIADGNTYFNKLVDLSGLEQELAAQTEEYRALIDEHILWVRSTEPLGAPHLRAASEAIAWLADGGNWSDAGHSLWMSVASDPLVAAAGIVAFLFLVASRGRFRKRLHQSSELASMSYTQPFRHTALAFLWTLLLALPWPALMWFAGWELARFVESSDFARSVGLGLMATAGMFLAMESYRQVFRPVGLAAQHFRWRPERLQLNRNSWRWLLVLGLPLVFLVAMTETQDRVERRDSLGRLALVAGLLLLAAFIARLLRPSLLRPRTGAPEDPTVSRWKFTGYLIAVAAPLLLAGLAAFGYQYTALELTLRLVASVGLALGLILAQAMIARWLYAVRARLALEQVARQSEQELPIEGGQSVAEEAGGTILPATETVEVPRQTVDLAKINQQTRRLLRNATAVAAAFGFWLIWADILPALGILDQSIWSTTVEVTRSVTGPDDAPVLRTLPEVRIYTVGDLLFAAVILAVVIVAARNLPGLLHVGVLQYLPLDAGGLYAVNTLIRYAIVMVGGVFLFGAIGVSWSHVQWLVAALGVGLGFGLQEIFANFVSGLILLFERPIRVGDVVTVENVTGVVVDIRMRATTVRDWDYKEFIVPNKELITGKLLNWTLASPMNRLVVNVGVSYDCQDTERARELLLNVARANPHILGEPAPLATFEGFGDSTLNFVLRAFLPNLENRLAVVHDLHSSILREFRQAGIEIAFPQRDIHIRSIQAVLPVEERNGRPPRSGSPDGGRAGKPVASAAAEPHPRLDH